jgi:ribosome recycling factor
MLDIVSAFCAKLHFMSDTILANLKVRLDQTIEVVKKDLSSVRTGRAKPSLVEDVKVEAYGTIMAIKELATINAPDTTLIVISPWDKGLVSAISSGIQKSGLNIQPIVDGDTVKISIPALTEERRLELVKLVHSKLESAKVMVRGVRTEIKEEIEAQKGEAGISEDSIKAWLESMQKTVDSYMTKVEELEKEKEKELMTL